MAARIILLDFAFVAFFTLVISSPLDGYDNHQRIRRQFGTPDSSLQQTVQGIQSNRRPSQSGNNQGQPSGGFTSGSTNGQNSGGFISGSNNGQAQGSGNTQGQSTGGFSTGGFNTGSGQNGGGFNSGSGQGQGFGNNQGQGSGNNQGQNGGGFSSGSSNGQGQGFGGSNSGNNQGQGLNQPTTVQNPYVTIVNSEYQLSNELVQCIRKCPSTSHFNPICGSDNVTYTNESRMKCAQKCGRRVTEVYRGSCVPSATTTPAVPISG